MKPCPSASRREFLLGAAGSLLAVALVSARSHAAPLGDAASAAANLARRAAGTFERPRLVHTLARGLAMIPGRAPVVAVAERGLFAIASRPAKVADAARFETSLSSGQSATLMRSKYLGLVLDPWMMQPVEEHRNEVTGTRISVAPRRIDEAMLIAGGAALVRSTGDSSSVRRRRISEAVFGEETIITSFETSLAAPESRPSVTSLSFRALAAADDRTPPAFDFSMAQMFAAEDWAWLGFPPERRVQIMLNMTGKSVDDRAALDRALLAQFEADADFLSFAD